MKKILSMLLICALVLGLTACGSAASAGSATAAAAEKADSAPAEGQVYHIRGATSNVETHPHYLGLVKFAELLDQKSNGRIKMEAFHSGTLGSERDLIEGMQLGTIECGAITSGPLAGFTDAFLVFDLPYLFPSAEKARLVCKSDLGKEMLASVEPAGLKGLAFFENGMRSVTTNTKPIEKPEDMKGMKIRTMENTMHMECFKAMGADPTPMAFGELYTALQQGAMDAQENPFTVIYSSKFYEVQKYLSITEHLYSPTPLIMSLSFFNSLPADLQQVVLEAAKEAAEWQYQCCDEQNAELLGQLEKAGMLINKPEKDAFRAATQTVYDNFVGKEAGKVDPDILAKVEEMIK